ncbi:hypothetical protein KZ813_06020 [Sphingomonas sp. RHCKR7]|uniref:hypothetical protein n=1 Tax=Sphingomonas folli TaxID=2862497 RepID=UPI001CA5DE50|nr:hypothetical protein [Sphingomonas folli]MBW6526391.1 hypothetical protein [Sphingomonas folli]
MSRYRVKRKLLLDGGRRVLLYFWGHETAARIHNLECLDEKNELVWRAALPPSEIPDCFVSIERDGDALAAHTFSGHRLIICSTSGATLASA